MPLQCLQFYFCVPGRGEILASQSVQILVSGGFYSGFIDLLASYFIQRISKRIILRSPSAIRNLIIIVDRVLIGSILLYICWLLKEPVFILKVYRKTFLLAACVLCHSFRSFADSVLGQLSGQEQTNRSLNFSRRNGRFLVVVGQTRSFTGNSLKNIIHERVHDAHSLAGDTSIGVDLLQNFVNIDSIAFFTFGSSLLAATNSASGFLASFLPTF